MTLGAMARMGRPFLRSGLCLCLLFGAHLTRANAPGVVVYAPVSAAEFMAYARVIRLQHGGKSENGTLLATFEHWRSDGQPTPFLIERSRDEGRTWQLLSSVYDGETGPGHPWPIMFQPFLFEMPRRLGRYPAGTLLLAGNVCPGGVGETHFQLWRSAAHGTRWAYVSTFQTGGSGRPGRGIWEPFLALDRAGRLVCYFSDERQWATHSQFLGHLVSPDGGDTWGPEVADVASARQPDRPGMATVAHIPKGDYVMSYEVCGPLGCEAHVKMSPDGDTWGDAADLGVRPETADGRYLVGSPYIAWTPAGGADGTLLLVAHFENRRADGTSAPESAQVIFVNTHGGRGAWSWMPAPFLPVMGTRGHASPNYSPCLLPSPDGATVRLMTSSGGGALGQERTESAPLAVLPYTAPLARGDDAGWMDYGGDWAVHDGAYWDTAGGAGEKAVAGSTGWTDYSLTADVRLASAGQAGLLVRVTNPDVGPDALSGYYVGLVSAKGTLILGREDGGWTPLGSVPVLGGVAVGVWYRLTVRAVGGHLSVTVRRPGTATSLARLSVTDAHFPAGAIGLRADNATAAWRNVEVTPP